MEIKSKLIANTWGRVACLSNSLMMCPSGPKRHTLLTFIVSNFNWTLSFSNFFSVPIAEEGGMAMETKIIATRQTPKLISPQIKVQGNPFGNPNEIPPPSFGWNSKKLCCRKVIKLFMSFVGHEVSVILVGILFASIDRDDHNFERHFAIWTFSP